MQSAKKSLEENGKKLSHFSCVFFFLLFFAVTMASIQCGICKNVMPSKSFITHKERKHSMEPHVPYIKLLMDDLPQTTTNNGDLMKCRFCPNRIPANTMEKHMKRCHIECELCKKTYLKSNYSQHMQQKHNLIVTSKLSESKSSLQSTDSKSSLQSSDSKSSLKSSYSKSSLQSSGGSSSSSITSFQMKAAQFNDIFECDPPLVPYRPPPQLSPSSFKQSPPPKHKSDVIRVNEWQLHNYIRQGRVYTKNGCLYLRHVISTVHT